MDRTLIAWNIPNLITIPLMAFVAFLLVGVIVQLVKKQMGGSGADDQQSGGY